MIKLGDIPYRTILPNDDTKSRSVRGRQDFASVDLTDIRALLENEETPRGVLIDIAASRFGIPRGMLDRKSADAVRDELWTAVRHESSISIISDVARRGS
jgi:hypothetical protein